MTKTIMTILVAIYGIAVGTHAASFTGLGTLPGQDDSVAYSVSADGSMAVGYSSYHNSSSDWDSQAFMLTQSGGMEALQDPSGISDKSWAYDVSADGTTIVGYYDTPSRDSYAFRWTLPGGMVGLGSLAAGGYSVATGVSSNGAIVVGFGYGNPFEAFMWTQSGGMVGLGDLAGGSFDSRAEGISGDGSTVVGRSTSSNGVEAFVWMQSAGMVGLGDLDGGSFDSRAEGVSVDGSTVVGRSTSSNGVEAFVWTQSGGMVGLGDLDGGSFYSVAEGVSGDGSTVVGRSTSTNGVEAFVWDEINGMRPLKAILEEGGVDMTAWTLRVAEDVSDDGTTVVGYGSYSNGNNEAFIAVLPSPPGEIEVLGKSGSLVDGGNESFGNQAVGVGKVLNFTISNEMAGSSTSLNGLSISKDGTGASSVEVGPLGTTSLGEGESTTFRVTYTPPSIGSHTAAIYIFSNDSDENPFTINLTGTGLANADSDPGSDAWEVANGFDPNTSGDVMTLDSDGDGSPDIWEMYQGTDRYGSGGGSFAPVTVMLGAGDDVGNGFSGSSVSNGILKVLYRRDTTQNVVNAQSVWLPDLMAGHWLYSGESHSGTVVTVTENVVNNGPAFEIIEAASEVTTGDSDVLFYTLELTPNE